MMRMVGVDRTLLPWHRQASAPTPAVTPLTKAFRSRHPKAPTSLIVQAYRVA